MERVDFCSEKPRANPTDTMGGRYVGYVGRLVLGLPRQGDELTNYTACTALTLNRTLASAAWHALPTN
jgi:hypothetical protein